MKKKLQSIGIALLYVMFFFGIQSIFTTIPVIPAIPKLIRAAVSDPLGYAEAAKEIIYVEMPKLLAPMLIISDILTLVALYFIFKDRKRNLFEKIQLKRMPVFRILLPAVLGISLNVLVTYVLSLLPLPQSMLEQSEQTEGLLFSGNIVLAFIAVAVCGPFLEEVIYRGCIFTTLKRNFSVTAAVVIQALLFGLSHFYPISVAYAFLLGIALVYVFGKTGSLWSSILLHMSFNASSFILTALPEFSKNIEILLVSVSLLISALLLYEIPRICRTDTDSI